MIADKKLGRYVPLLVWIIAALTIVVIPLKVIGLGFLPPDDALRHAARAVTGRPWAEILVLGDVMKMEHNFGWHALLRGIHLGANADAEALVIFSIIAMFSMMGLSGLAWLRRPEAWLVPLILVAAGAGLMSRFMLGRPFLLTIAALVTVLMLWQKRGASRPNWRDVTLMTLVIAIACFVHGCWYLWTLPIAAFFLAQQWRWAFVFAVSWALGMILGALPTGHPIDFTWQAIDVAFKALGAHQTQRTMVGEYQPLSGDCFALLVLAALAVLRSLVKLNVRPLTKNPAFWLACLGWAFGFKAGRFWLDWGWPALMVLVACDVQAWMQARVTENSLQRLGIACSLAGTLFLASTNDVNSRWTYSLGKEFLNTTEQPELAGWMPDDGGVLYSTEMGVFYRTFYKNPDAHWRYILGYEPIFMPRDDFKIYESILANGDAPIWFMPWVKKMKPADRLVVRASSGAASVIRQLEWNCDVAGVCIGRLPRVKSPAPAP